VRAHRVKLAVLIILLLVQVVLLLALAGYHTRAWRTPYIDRYAAQHYRHQVAFTPTGDEPFDTYAVAVAALYHEAKSPFSDTARNGDRIPLLVKVANPTSDVDLDGLVRYLDSNSLFANLAEFEDTPEYWELKYMVDFDKADLQEAFDRGLATPVLINLFDLQAMATAEPQRALDLINHGIALDPDNSFCYYQKANILILQGEMDQAREALIAGNSAPRNEWPRLYPQRIVDKLLRPGLDPDGQVVACVTLEQTPMPRELYTMRNTSKVVDALAEGENPELLNEWLIYNQRRAMMHNQCITNILISIGSLDQAMRDSLEIIEFSESDQARIWAAQNKVEQIRQFIIEHFIKRRYKEMTSFEKKHELLLEQQGKLAEIQDHFAKLDLRFDPTSLQLKQ
jgi:tetratricopeptide (TPR) repeat protein